MKSSSLRIGNWVYNNKNVKVTSKQIDLFDEGIYQLAPIPLTEEWLLKFGLKLNGYNRDDKAVYSKSDNVWIVKNNVTKKYYLDEYDLEIKYVHQLQNLYFALTSKELEIKQHELN